jgi:hypothetical protein
MEMLSFKLAICNARLDRGSGMLTRLEEEEEGHRIDG